MKKILLSAGVLALALCALAGAKDQDPVLMTVNGKPVHVSEFEYLYHKNNAQQLQPQSLDDYVKMFVDYKLKVADAEAAGIDTTGNFMREYEQFRSELAAPYMVDSAKYESLLREAYQHQLRNVKVSHLMLRVDNSMGSERRAMLKADSIRNAILSGQISWDDAVAKYTVDVPTRNNGGSMGWLVPGRFPWPFEKMAYDTETGKISEPVNSGFGIHLVRPDDSREATGKIQARHILVSTMRKKPEYEAIAKQKIDSIYGLLKSGADFEELARNESEDRGTASKGGMLGWFAPGTMVAEFDSVVFSLGENEISEPFKTNFGYHIAQRLGHKPVETFEELRPELEQEITMDARNDEPREARMKQLLAEHKAHVLEPGIDAVVELINANGKYDSLAVERLRVSNIPVIEVNGIQSAASEMVGFLPSATLAADSDLRPVITAAAERLLEQKTAAAERDALMEKNADYRNLVNEYRDGILLFEVSNNKVWERATKDRDGLQSFFEKNREKYKFDKPKFKGYIVFASTDSVALAAEAYCNSLGDNFNADTFVADMRDRFGRDVKVERVIAANGDNPISDFLAFGGPRPDDSKLRWKYFFAFRGRIINAPEDALDVRGPVTTDYQNVLEKEWLSELHKAYPVKIDKKVLKQVK